MQKYYMRKALELANLGLGLTSPNPLVGSVIVKENIIVGKGWHQKSGTAHAEINALRSAGNKAQGSKMFVTLEPCCSYGQTGPCTEAIISAGISEVIIAIIDPNPMVSGKGIQQLKNAGIKIKLGILACEAIKQNEVYLKWITTRLPFTVLKIAMSLDGKITTYKGQSKWITGKTARKIVHQLRNNYDAILIGIGTALVDDPKLTVRNVKVKKNPIRIVVDTRARIPLTAKLLNDQTASTIIVVSEYALKERILMLSRKAEVLLLPEKEGHINLRVLFEILGKKAITSILVEGGARINEALLSENLIDKINIFIAPKIIGGNHTLGPVLSQNINGIKNVHLVEDMTVQKISEDILITGYFKNREGRDVYGACGRIGECKKNYY